MEICNLINSSLIAGTFGKRLKKKKLEKIAVDESVLAFKIMDKDCQILALNFRKISHPNFLKILNVISFKGMSIIWVKWSYGPNLQDYIKTFGAIPEQKSKVLFYQMVCGIRFLHELNLAHTNLNLTSFIIEGDFIKICKLYNLKQSKGNEKIDEKHEESKMRYFLPPEVNNEQPWNPKKCDIYSLGIVLMIMLNALIPFPKEKLSELVQDQLKRKFVFKTSNIRLLSIDCQMMMHILLEPNDDIRWSIDKIHDFKWLSKFTEKQGDG